MGKKKFKTQKLSKSEAQEKCTKCSRWISLDEYILNNSKCYQCKEEDHGTHIIPNNKA